jgi:hypothetical protein
LNDINLRPQEDFSKISQNMRGIICDTNSDVYKYDLSTIGRGELSRRNKNVRTELGIIAESFGGA